MILATTLVAYLGLHAGYGLVDFDLIFLAQTLWNFKWVTFSCIQVCLDCKIICLILTVYYVAQYI